MLKIKASVFSDYLQKVRIPGESGISEFVLRTGKDGMSCVATSAGVGAVQVVANLNRKVFQIFEENLVITVGDGDKLQKYIDRFNDIVELHLKENRLIILSETKKAEMILASKDFIKEDIKEKGFKFDKYISLEPEIFSDVLKNKDLTKSDYITIEVRKGVLYISAGEKNFDVFTEKVDGIDYDDVKSLYASGVESVFGQLNKKCKIALKNFFPMEIRMLDESMSIKYFIAPRIEDTNEEKEETQELKEKAENFDKENKK